MEVGQAERRERWKRVVITYIPLAAFTTCLLKASWTSGKLDERVTTGRPGQEVHDWLRGKSGGTY